ncbi:MAG: anion permease [Planctomycetota bacterium]|nr:MAG: anion permease [Planctomycetota bacterium]
MFGEWTILVVLVIFAALAFDYINGFHDTANAIATVVSTRVLSPRDAILMATVLNFAGAYWSGGKVAKTVSSGLVDPTGVTQAVVLAAIVGAIAWNLITWYYGIPSSSSHALMGGLCGAAITHAAGLDVLIWTRDKPGSLVPDGLLWKAIIPIFLSPLGAFVVGMTVMWLIFFLFQTAQPGRVGRVFRWMQIASSAMMSVMHGSNDAQKSMGIITMALFTQGLMPDADPKSLAPPAWVIGACALAMAAGTSVGGWRIIKTMGHKIIKLEPVHGFAAETSAAAIIGLADFYSAPISTTHTISGAIFGVGAAKRLAAVRWAVAERMVVAWFLTLPASGIVAAITYWLLTLCGLE